MRTLRGCELPSRQHLDKYIATVSEICSKASKELEQAHRYIQHVIMETGLYNVSQKNLMYGLLVIITLVWAISRARRASNATPRTPDVEKRSPFRALERQPGGTAHMNTLFHNNTQRLS
jgi:hypothetical protein